MLSIISGVSLVVHLMAQTSFSQQGQLLLTREEEGSIYSINPDGSNLRKWAEGQDPVRSPDGRFILVSRQGVMVSVSSDGTASLQLGVGGQYTWSPDGERIAFLRRGSIYVINKDGSGERQLVQFGGTPFWSPTDSLMVYYNLARPTSFEITDLFLLNIATGESELVRELTAIPETSYPFSPEGTRMFVWDSKSQGTKIMDRVTGELVQIGLSGERESAQRPAWSPDGNHIVFEVFEGMGGLYVANSEGETVTTLVPGRSGVTLGGAVWSLNGDMIAFHMRDSVGSQKSQIYVINADSAGMRKLAEGSWPIWTSMQSTYQLGERGQVILTWGTLKHQFAP